MSERYPWILKPARRQLPPINPSHAKIAVCTRCGLESKGRRKKCPACHHQYEQEARTDDQ